MAMLVITRWYNGDNHSGIFFMGMLHQQYRFWVWHLQFDEPPNDRWIWRCFKCLRHSQNHRVVLEFCGKCSPQTWRPKKPRLIPELVERNTGRPHIWVEAFFENHLFFTDFPNWICEYPRTMPTKASSQLPFKAASTNQCDVCTKKVRAPPTSPFAESTQWTIYWGLTSHLWSSWWSWDGNHGRLHSFTLQ
jgi:hypothetical protein